VQDRQLEEAVVLSEAAGNLQAAEETAEREDRLLVALSEAQSSLVNLQKLHEASQKQLFNMQSRTEEEQVAFSVHHQGGVRKQRIAVLHQHFLHHR